MAVAAVAAVATAAGAAAVATTLYAVRLYLINPHAISRYSLGMGADENVEEKTGRCRWYSKRNGSFGVFPS